MKIHFRILSLVMAFAVTFSSVGVTISKHICGDEVRDIAFFHNAEPCQHASEPAVVHCPTHEGMVIHLDSRQDNCCADTIEVLKEDHPKNVTSSDISISSHFFLLFTYNLFLSHINTININNGSTYYDPALPPLINQSKYILVNIFRL